MKILLVILLATSMSCSKLRHNNHHHSSPLASLWDTITSNDQSSASATKNSLHESSQEIEENFESTSTSNEFEDDFVKFHKHSAAKNCKTCQNGVKMTEEELTALRIEFVKNQILKKLRLTERPNVSIKDLPKPITEKLVPEPEPENVNRQLEDYYGKTTKKFIFLQEANNECAGLEVDSPHICLKFQIPPDVERDDVLSASLWIYKKHDKFDAIQAMQTIEVDDVSHWDHQGLFFKTKPIALTNTNVTEGWIKVDIQYPVENWKKYHELTHILRVSCKTCGNSLKHSPVSLKHKRKPFIVIDTQAQRKSSRQKRNINCSSGTTECCREKLYISFEEIGWDDWIVFPKGYDAYFCRGSCNSAASVTLSSSHHTSIKLMLQRQRNSGGKQLELIPCCTATQFSSLQLFYMDSNNTATQKTLPNMIVSSCGCM
ncbi:growth/differentiation factor 8 isoform X2 [Culicoides brevitarsis]|uniref:growth/differentiation factor 8 isoform X2 n=1 Tax=Culicoides brevitarsis TaxID=469753 RepID=UPI00307B1B34